MQSSQDAFDAMGVVVQAAGGGDETSSAYRSIAGRDAECREERDEHHVGDGERILSAGHTQRRPAMAIERAHTIAATEPATAAAVPMPPITWPATLLCGGGPVVVVVLPCGVVPSTDSSTPRLSTG